MSTREQAVAAIGETLIVLQKVERFLAAVLMHMADPAEAGRRLEKALLRDKETLGRLLAHFGDRVELPPNFAEEFDELLRDRNTFIHDLFMESWFDLNIPNGRAKLDDFLRRIRNRAGIATRVMMASLTDEQTHARRSPASQAYIERIFRRIEATAHPDVQARVNEEYISKVREDAQSSFAVSRKQT